MNAFQFRFASIAVALIGAAAVGCAAPTSGPCGPTQDQICHNGLSNCRCGDPCGQGADCASGMRCAEYASKPGGVCVDQRWGVETLAPPIVYPSNRACHPNLVACLLDCYGGAIGDPCRADCHVRYPCFPWDRGVQPGPPCRVTFENFECNALCFNASSKCKDDCFHAYASFPSDVLQTCWEDCEGIYGCHLPTNDPCTPLPPGYVRCACPETHGVNCHSDDGRSC